MHAQPSSGTTPPTVTIVIPTRNEEKSLGAVITGAKPHGDEVLVMDGHSTDGSRRVAEELGARVVLDDGRGKGAAIRQSLREATGDLVVFIDADGSHSTDDIPRLLEPLRRGEADLVLGSRMRGGSDELHGDLGKFIRMVGSDIITLSINYRFGVRLTDSQNGLRAVRREACLAAGLTEDIFTIEQEMVMKMLKKKARVTEVATHEYARLHGKSGISVPRVAHRYLWCLVKNLF